jgi:tripartite-type tricarboxylate transporter receptor subunit TctC
MKEAHMLKAQHGIATAIAAAVVLPASGAALAQSASDFYSKAEMTIVVGYNPGGTYDLYSRMAARHLGNHLPGKPNIIVKNVPGVGSLKAANYLYEQAPKDGATLGMVSQSVALQQVLKHRAVRYDARKFRFIGRMTQATEVTIVWHTVPVKTIADARKREVVMGATSPGSSADTNPRLMNEFAGTMFKNVLGYKGTTGAMRAMERGEVEGSLAVIQSLIVSKKDWIKENKIRVLVQYALERHPAFPDAPAMTEFGDSDEEKQILRLFGSTASVGRALMVPPDVPADRLAMLRTAFDAMLKDPAFLADMKAKNMELDPASGQKVQALIDDTYKISPKAAARAAAARNAGKKKKK